MPTLSQLGVSNWMSQLLTWRSQLPLPPVTKRSNQPTRVLIGEIGLTGEIRRVNRIEQRINEAAKLGLQGLCS
jgi:hypothetical protein